MSRDMCLLLEGEVEVGRTEQDADFLLLEVDLDDRASMSVFLSDRLVQVWFDVGMRRVPLQ